MVVFSQSRSPDQYALPTRTIGNFVILPVATRVSASKSSSIVPKPPGRTTNACEYLMKTVFDEEVAELKPYVHVVVEPRLKRQLDAEADRDAARLARALVGRLHDARP